MPTAYPPAVRIVGLDNHEASLRASLLSHATSDEYIGKANGYRAAALRLVERMEDFDLVHAHDWLTFAAACEIKRVTGRPLVVHVHSTEKDRSTPERENPAICAIERHGMEAADRIVTVSRYSKQRLIRQYGQTPGKVEVIYNAGGPGTAKQACVRSPENGYILYVGRITEQKGPEAFVEAARGIHNAFPDARFVMAGDGDLLPVIRSRVDALGLAESFLFPGFVDHEDVARLLAKSSVLVMPSLSEPFGLAALEAVQAGVPVVISRNCGLSEQVPSVVSIDPKEIQEIVDAVTGILRDPDSARARAHVALREAARLDWKTSAGRLLLTYRSVLEESRERHIRNALKSGPQYGSADRGHVDAQS